MIAGAQGVHIWVKENHDAHFLIILQHMPQKGQAGYARAENTCQKLQVNAAGKNHAEENRHEHQRGAKIRLLHNQQEGDAHIGRHRQQVGQGVQLAHLLLQESRQGNNHDNLGKLRGLQGNRSQLNPALGSQGRLSHKHDRQQHDQVKNIHLLPIPLQHLVVKIHQEDGYPCINQGKHALPLHEPVPLLAGCIYMSSTADNNQADNDYCRYRKQQLHIHFSQQLFI